MKTTDRLFIGVFPGGISYCDRGRMEHGDYRRLAFLPYHSLALETRGPIPRALLPRIRAHAATLIARRGEAYPIDACGHTVRLGGETLHGEAKTQAA